MAIILSGRYKHYILLYNILVGELVGPDLEPSSSDRLCATHIFDFTGDEPAREMLLANTPDVLMVGLIHTNASSVVVYMDPPPDGDLDSAMVYVSSFVSRERAEGAIQSICQKWSKGKDIRTVNEDDPKDYERLMQASCPRPVLDLLEIAHRHPHPN